MAFGIDRGWHRLWARDTRPYQSVGGIGFTGFTSHSPFNVW
jgi:hypothetical protein